MKKQLTITYSWWTSENKTPDVADQERLEEHAEEHISEMRVLGYTSGELNEEFNGETFTGHWEVNTKTL